jgi:hypothetical protein
LNGAIAGRCHGRPLNRHPVRGPGVVHVEASAGICTGVRLRMMRGREGEGGEVGNMMWNGECLFNDNCNDNEYDDAEFGKGSRGERTMGGNPTTTVATLSAGRPSAAWGIRHRSSALTPPPSSLTTTTTMIAAAVGGHRAPPPSGLSRSVRCRSSLSMLPTVVNVSGTGAFGLWSYAWWRRRRSAPLYSFDRF